MRLPRPLLLSKLIPIVEDGQALSPFGCREILVSKVSLFVMPLLLARFNFDHSLCMQGRQQQWLNMREPICEVTAMA
jgi:hypothetical protein